MHAHTIGGVIDAGFGLGLPGSTKGQEPRAESLTRRLHRAGPPLSTQSKVNVLQSPGPLAALLGGRSLLPKIPFLLADPLSFPKFSSAQIRAMRENQRIIRRDACDPSFAGNVCRR